MRCCGDVFVGRTQIQHKSVFVGEGVKILQTPSPPLSLPTHTHTLLVETNPRLFTPLLQRVHTLSLFLVAMKVQPTSTGERRVWWTVGSLSLKTVQIRALVPNSHGQRFRFSLKDNRSSGLSGLLLLINTMSQLWNIFLSDLSKLETRTLLL